MLQRRPGRCSLMLQLLPLAICWKFSSCFCHQGLRNLHWNRLDRKYRKVVGNLRTEGNVEDLFNNECQGLTTRRELIQWGPIIAAAISSATALPPQNGNAYSYSYNPQETALKEEIPFSTNRQYKSITLGNCLKVLLVSDKQAVRAASAFSIAGAGQFSDPEELPGCAHLMEHMILSSRSSSPFRKLLDFEDWLIDVEGASNAFTGYEQVCFHFTSPPGVLAEALARLSSLFNEPDVLKICQNEEILKREIRRVSSELNFESESIQEFYLTKQMMNPQHPYSRFARGNIDTLERRAKEAGVNVGSRLFEFFREYYQPANAVLVVIGPNDFGSLERWVAPFTSTLSRERIGPKPPRQFPQPLKASNKMRQVILYRPKVDFPLKENIEKLTMQWALELDYNEQKRLGRTVVTVTQIGFVLSQILGRRGPGSLYFVLYRRKWVPPGMQGLPRITFPVDVSGFQLMKFELSLTLEGFVNRAAVVATVFKAINSVFSGASMTKFLVSRQILAQYAVVAQLHGWILAPRPPDAIELAVDSLDQLDGQPFIPGEWQRFPLPNDRTELVALQKVVKDTLVQMSDPSNAIIITTATDKALIKAKENSILGETVPFVSPPKWQSAPLTDAKFYRDDLLIFPGVVGDLFSANAELGELLPPLTNNLIPPTLRPPRLSQQQLINMNEGRNENWRVLLPSQNTVRLPIPRKAPEASCRCSFVFQLLSPRPARANTRQAAYAELWKCSFERAVVDLAELGAPAGLAYDLSFNKFGMRLCFLGISQNLPSYARRVCRRLVKHHRDLLDGPEFLDKSVSDQALYEAMRVPGLSTVRRREIEKIIKDTTAFEAATEAIAFFKSCRGGCAFAQGDLLPAEISALFSDLETIFRKELGSRGKSENPTIIPSIDDLVYTPVWKPRFASSCSVPGVPLISDACGRVPR